MVRLLIANKHVLNKPLRRVTLLFTIVLLLSVVFTINEPIAMAAAPTMETRHADVANINVTLNGIITVTGGGTCSERGFVWDTVIRGDPGNTAPGASTYTNSWTEVGAFGIGAFDHDVTGLTELTLYYFRACAENNDGTWAYGEEREFFIGEEGKVYRGVRPDLDETLI